MAVVDRLHHFGDQVGAIREAFRVLRAWGVFLSVGFDPHAARDRWYVYEYFPKTVPYDLERYPAVVDIVLYATSARKPA